MLGFCIDDVAVFVSFWIEPNAGYGAEGNRVETG